jgi:hypothetical protein
MNSSEKAGIPIEKTRLHDEILANTVFIHANSEESLLTALDFDDAQN